MTYQGEFDHKITPNISRMIEQERFLIMSSNLSQSLHTSKQLKSSLKLVENS